MTMLLLNSRDMETIKAALLDYEEKTGTGKAKGIHGRIESYERMIKERGFSVSEVKPRK